jgi:PAS domain S-box-containing protein
MNKTYEMKDLNNYLEISPNGILIVNDNNIIINCNDTANRIFGYNYPNTLINNNLDILLPDEYIKAHHCYVKRFFEKPFKRIGRIFYGKHFTNTLIPIEIGLSFIKTVNDEIFNVCVIREVREKKQMELFNVILESVTDGIIIIDNNGLIQNLNKHISTLFKYDKHELLLQPIEILLPDHLKEYHIKKRNEYIDNTINIKTPDKYFPARKKDASIFFIDISLSKVIIDQLPSTIAIIRDVTNRKKFEEEIIKSKDDAIFESNAKSNFLSNMSHEIRTPLNGIGGIINLLQETTMTNKQSEYIELIKNCTDSLCVIINDILDYSKIIANKISIEPSTRNFILTYNHIKNMTVIMLEKKNITIHEKLINENVIDENSPIIIHIDFQRLTQIILNIISNAIKYTNEEGEIFIIYEFFNHIKQIHITVKDNKHLLFNMFSRVHNNDKLYQGTGLGLAITKHLVHLMNGTLKFESTLGIGSTFYVSLPYEDPIINNKIETDKLEYNWDKLKILIVEDNKINMMVTQNFLEKLTVKHIDTAVNGYIALQMALNFKYDIILMDIHMPILNGLETTEKLRQQKISTPIIALTASTFEKDIEDCIKVGMNDHIAKPFTLLTLQSKILKWL